MERFDHLVVPNIPDSVLHYLSAVDFLAQFGNIINFNTDHTVLGDQSEITVSPNNQLEITISP